jgi:hypothetical protein
MESPEKIYENHMVRILFQEVIQVLQKDTGCPIGRWPRKDIWKTCGPISKMIPNWDVMQY